MSVLSKWLEPLSFLNNKESQKKAEKLAEIYLPQVTKIFETKMYGDGYLRLFVLDELKKDSIINYEVQEDEKNFADYGIKIFQSKQSCKKTFISFGLTEEEMHKRICNLLERKKEDTKLCIEGAILFHLFKKTRN